MLTDTDAQILQVIKDEFETIEDFRSTIKYAKLSQVYAMSKAKVVLKRKALSAAEQAGNTELAELQQIENESLEALNNHAEIIV